jgi:hypothetical protein
MIKNIRKTIFVCSCISNNQLINKSIEANSQEEASSLFFQEFSIKPQEILGPFYKKKNIIKKYNTIQFSNQTKKVIYKNWLVNAFILNQPKDHAYLIFLKNKDKNIPIPKTIIVPLSELIER